jgi:hypothetical protein
MKTTVKTYGDIPETSTRGADFLQMQEISALIFAYPENSYKHTHTAQV